jgi:hypothetical protein
MGAPKKATGEKPVTNEPGIISAGLERRSAEMGQGAVSQWLKVRRELEDIKAVLTAETPAEPVQPIARKTRQRTPRADKIIDVVLPLPEPTPEEQEVEY